MSTTLDPCVIRDLEFEVVRMRINYPKQIEKHELADMQKNISCLTKYDPKISTFTDLKHKFDMRKVLFEKDSNISELMESDIKAFNDVQNQCKFLASWREKKKQTTLS